jgi:hypothetical protein
MTQDEAFIENPDDESLRLVYKVLNPLQLVHRRVGEQGRDRAVGTLAEP